MHEAVLWLQSDAYNTQLPKMNVCPGTLLWALPQFDAWYESPSSNILWIHGPAGCGKTTLLSFLEYRLRNGNTNIEKKCIISACKFIVLSQILSKLISIDRHNKQCAPLSKILKTLLLEVLRSNVSSPKLIDAVLSVKRRNIEHMAIQSNTQILWSILNSVLGALSQDVVYLMIDDFTMDSFEEEELVKLISDTISNGNGCNGLIKIMLTSGYSPRCASHRDTMRVSPLLMDPDTVRNDVQCFLTAALNDQGGNAITQSTFHDVLEDCHGMFACAVAAREYLSRKSTREGVMEKLPSWLWSAFDELIAPNFGDTRCRQVLSVIAVAARPLTVKELEHILEGPSTGGCQCVDSKSFCLATPIPSACIPFLAVSAGCIYFSHPKLRDYMTHSTGISASETHGALARRCIKVAWGESTHRPTEVEQESSQYLKLSARDPFLPYAVRHWSHHFLLSFPGDFPRHVAASIRAETKDIIWMEKAQGNSIQSTQELESYLRDNLEARRRIGVQLQDIMKSIVEVASDANRRGDVLYTIALLVSITKDTQFRKAPIEQQYYILSTLGRCYSRTSQWQDAERYCRQSIDVYTAHPRQEVLESIRAQNSLGWIIKAQNRLVDASRIFMRSYLASRRMLGSDHDETILALTEIVHLYERRGKFGVPMRVLLLHLWASGLDHGVEHISITKTLNLIVELQSQRGRIQEAEIVCLELLEASKTRHRPNASLGIVLAGLYGKQSKWSEASEVLLALAQHPNIQTDADVTSKVLVNLADAQMANGSWGEAITTLSTCTLSPLSREDNQQLHIKTARCEEAVGRSKVAEKNLRAILEEEEEVGRWRTRTVLTIGEELTAFYERQNAWDQALEVYEEIHHGFITVLGQNHRYAIASNTAVADFMERRSEWAKVNHLQKDIAAMTADTRGITHHRVKQAQRKSLIAGLYTLVA